MWKRSKRAFEDFKRYADNTRRFDRGRPLASYASPEWLLYAANPVYIETSRGWASPLRGFGALIYLGMFVSAAWIGADSIRYGLKHDWLLVILGPILLLVSLLPAMLLAAHFLAPTDATIRFDRKRRVAYVWTYKKGAPEARVIEIPWERLTPVVQGTAASTHLPGSVYRGMYVDYGPDGQPRTTEGVPHVLHIGQQAGNEEGALFHLEYVRRYMEEGLQAVPQPQIWLTRRPNWRAMFNFVMLIDSWKNEFQKPSPIAPWMETAFLALGFPVVFPTQMTHWLALKVAPLAKWPKALIAQHAADLQAMGLPPDAGTPKLAPVDKWRERWAAWTAIPLAFASPVLIWGRLWDDVLPFEISLKWAAILSVLMGIAATAIAILTLPRAAPGSGDQVSNVRLL